MKRTLWAISSTLLVFLAVLTFLIMRPIPKAAAFNLNKGCSNKMLFGTFGFVGTGFYLQDETDVPADVSGQINFTGNGNFTASNLNLVANGQALPGNPYSVPTGDATATYTVSPNCAFTATVAGQFGVSVTVTLNGTIVNSTATEIFGNLSSSNPNVTGTFHAIHVPPAAVTSPE